MFRFAVSVLLNVKNSHDIISSSWFLRKISAILTRAFCKIHVNWKIITLYITPWLTLEENMTHCVVLKINIFKRKT